jgi:hypothetical protein
MAEESEHRGFRGGSCREARGIVLARWGGSTTIRGVLLGACAIHPAFFLHFRRDGVEEDDEQLNRPLAPDIASGQEGLLVAARGAHTPRSFPLIGLWRKLINVSKGESAWVFPTVCV